MSGWRGEPSPPLPHFLNLTFQRPACCGSCGGRPGESAAAPAQESVRRKKAAGKPPPPPPVMQSATASAATAAKRRQDIGPWSGPCRAPRIGVRGCCKQPDGIGGGNAGNIVVALARRQAPFTQSARRRPRRWRQSSTVNSDSPGQRQRGPPLAEWAPYFSKPALFPAGVCRGEGRGGGRGFIV